MVDHLLFLFNFSTTLHGCETWPRSMMNSHFGVRLNSQAGLSNVHCNVRVSLFVRLRLLAIISLLDSRGEVTTVVEKRPAVWGSVLTHAVRLLLVNSLSITFLFCFFSQEEISLSRILSFSSLAWKWRDHTGWSGRRRPLRSLLAAVFSSSRNDRLSRCWINVSPSDGPLSFLSILVQVKEKDVHKQSRNENLKNERRSCYARAQLGRKRKGWSGEIAWGISLVDHSSRLGLFDVANREMYTNDFSYTL